MKESFGNVRKELGMERSEPIEHELLRNATIAEIAVTKVTIDPTARARRCS